MEKEIYFGDKTTFAIRYVPGYTFKNSTTHYYAYCHLVLGGQIIGDKDEICYLSSWRYSVEGLKNNIKNNRDSFSHQEFEGRNDRELFELIWKANQLEDEYKPEFNHLPVLDSKVWSTCHISIDETTDAFLTTVTLIDKKLKFLWEGWRDPCPQDCIGKLYSVSVDPDFVIEAMEKCLRQIEGEYLDFPVLKRKGLN